MLRRLLRKPLTWVIAGLLGIGAGLGMYWFQPWKLISDQTVNETAPPTGATTSSPAVAQQPTGNRVLATGVFITHEHATKGDVQITESAGGGHLLTIVDLDTSNGPDLRVWLTDQRVLPGRAGWFLFDDGRYLELGRLKGNKGTQNYEIPAGTDLTQYRSVTIWCKRFSVSFGAAELTAA